MADDVPISITNAVHNIVPIFRSVNSLKNLERTLHEIIEQIVKDFNCATCAIIVIDPVTELLNIKSFHGLSWNFYKNFQKSIDTPVLKEMLWKEEPISIMDSSFNPVVSELLRLENEFVSCLAVPIIVNQKPLGYLHLDSKHSDNFSAEHKLLAEFYANLIGMTLFREELSEELKRLDYRDKDSGAVRYAHFFTRLQELFQQAERLQDPFSIIMIDIEGYSAIVKTYGTEVTNEMLSELVHTINGSLRKYDGLSRFGTDEFMLTLPGTRLHEAKQAGKKFCAILSGKAFSREKLNINFFMGVSNYPENCSSLDGLLTATRNALLEAKRSNRVNSVVALKQIVD